MSAPLTVPQLAERRPLTPAEVAGVYNRPLPFVEAWIRQGRLPCFTIGRAVRIPWTVVVERYCGCPASDLIHPDDAKAQRRVRQHEEAMRNAERERAFWEPRWPHTAIIYLIEAPKAGMIKIGRTTDLRERFDALRTASPVPIRVMAWTIDRPRLERELHKRYAHNRQQGEWFIASAGLRNIASQWLALRPLPEWCRDE